MEIHIDNNFRLTSDQYNVFLEERKVAKSGKNKGKVLWERVANCPNIKKALKRYLDYRQKNDETYGVEELIDLTKECKINIKRIANKLELEWLDGKEIR